MSIMSTIRARASNPVIDTAFAERIAAETSANKFDIHEHIADLYSGMPEKFMADLYSGLVWHLDNVVIANTLKQLANKLPADAITIDSHSELQNTLDEMWASELHSYEVGYEAAGPLHTIMYAMNVRQAWIDFAQVASTAMNKAYAVPALTTTIGSPKRQKVSSEFLANAAVDALTDAGIITNATARLQFSVSVNLLKDIKMIESRVKADHPFSSAEAQQELIEADVEYQAVITKLSQCPEAVSAALETYERDITQREALLGQWYERELARIPVQNKIMDYCQRKMLAECEDLVQFYDLPAQMQVNACASAIASLNKTTAGFKDKAPYVYSAYKKVTASAVELLNRVIKTHCE